MFGSIILFVIAAVAGFRRGKIDGKAVVAVAMISLFLVVVAAVGLASLHQHVPRPDAMSIAVGFLGYFLPLLAGFALGAEVMKQRLKNDAESDGTA